MAYEPFITDVGDLESSASDIMCGRYGVWAFDENLLRYQVIATGLDLVPLLEAFNVPLERVYRLGKYEGQRR